MTAEALARADVAGLVPCHLHAPERALLERLMGHVGELLVVDDGMPAQAGRDLDRLAREIGARVLRLPVNAGKGHALAAGIRQLLAGARPPAAVLVVDADGQHDPALAPSFIAAARGAELVIGDRFEDLAAMPLVRRAANTITSRILAAALGAPMRDTQCGMRLLRGRALAEVPFLPGGYEAETRHLKRCVRAGVPVAWVPIPALYEGQRSSFRPLVDSARVLIAALG